MHKRTNEEMIKCAADYLVAEFKKQGFTVLRYDAMTSLSVYLKLDDGVSGSIRISDHEGKKHLRYRYNLIKDSNLYKKEDKGVTRYFFPMREIKLLVDKVVYDRNQLYMKFGRGKYNSFMKQNRKDGENKPGFWQSAIYV